MTNASRRLYLVHLGSQSSSLLPSAFSISFFSKNHCFGLQSKHTLRTCAVVSIAASAQILKHLPLQPDLSRPSGLPAMSTSARRRLMRDFKVVPPLHASVDDFYFDLIQARIVSSTRANNV